METERDESEQLPEDAPPSQIHADDEESDRPRDEAEETAGVPNEGGQATGNPANAG